MSYGEWDEGFQDVYDEIPGIPYLDDWEQDYVEELFERGFTHTSDEPDYNSYEVMLAREEFFDYLGLLPEDFPWADWREVIDT